MAESLCGEEWLGFEWQHIPSLCDYMETKYRPEHKKYITWQRANLELKEIDSIDLNFSIGKRYDRSEISKYLGVVHIPYNLSIMSAFEHYYQGIPLFFPSLDFQVQLFRDDSRMLSEILFPDSLLTFSSNLVKLADWYDSSNMPYVQYFESYEHLKHLLSSSKLSEISGLMQDYNVVRKFNVYSQWDMILEEIQ